MFAAGLMLLAAAALAIGQGPAFPTTPEAARLPAVQNSYPQYVPNSVRTVSDGLPSVEPGWLRMAQQPDAPADPLATTSEPTANGQASTTTPPADAAETDPQSEQRAAQLKQIAANLETAKQWHGELEKEQADWQQKLTSLKTSGLEEPRPYSFLSLDKARDELAAEQQAAKLQHDVVADAKEAASDASDELAEAERALRKANEDIENNEDAEAGPALAAAAADADHAVAVRDLTLALRRAESENEQLEEQVQQIRLDYAEQKLELYELDSAFTPSMLDEVTVEIDSQIRSAAVARTQLDRNLNYLQDQWAKARQRLDDAKASGDESNLAALQAEVQAKDLAQQTADLEANILVNRQERLQSLKPTWQRRFEVVNNSVSSGESADWTKETKTSLEQLRSDAATLNARISSVRKQLTSIEKKRQNADESDVALRYWLDQSSQSLERQRRASEKALAELDLVRQVHQKLLTDLTAGTISDTASRWAAQAWDNVCYVWEYPLTTVGDESITAGKLVQGVFLFLAGILASRWISHIFGRRFLKRMGVNAGAIAALQSVAFYLLVVCFTLFALKLVKVPLTAFTVLGGAVALGVGFGSQNIVNNFISGLILLAERPVKVGDLIQLADVYGNVERIGARSARIRTGENLDIIVPNSTFLETNVVNWTLSDNHMRTKVLFGVAYGSPTGKVTQLALKAAANHDRVFDRPAPLVIFANFGDNALEFELHFWVAVRTLMERRTIESDIRYNIDHLFREAGITIAFPQRDVHLFPHEPIQVQMLPPESDATANDAA